MSAEFGTMFYIPLP